MYHYTYRISNKIDNKHYYGSRTTKRIPIQDLGIKYFSSSRDKDFIKDQKNNPQNYNYKVIKVYNSRKDAIALEIKLHNKFNVGVNENFYNQVKQSSTGFDTTGVIFIDGKKITSEEYKNGNYTYHSANALKGRKFSQEHRKKLSDSAKGKPKSREAVEKMKLTRELEKTQKGDKHPRFKGYYITPFGKFDSPAALEPLITLTQMKGYCNKNNRLISKQSYQKSNYLQENYTFEDISDKTFKDLGFDRQKIK